MFKVAIVGRPNVGKSTLFNFLSGKSTALTSPISGLTRDRKEIKAKLYDMEFILIDTGGYDNEEDIINHKIWQQAQIAIEEANSIIFMLDGKSGVSPIDKVLADTLRKISKPIIAVVNKADTNEAKKNLPIFYELGFADVYFISAEHGIGMADLYHALQPDYQNYLTNHELEEKTTKPELSLAFVGKPNAGKSTIINNLLHEERLITTDIAGTTRDSIYLDFYYEGKKIKIIDTAGLRRRSKVTEESVEKLANKDSIKTIVFATVVALVISADEGLTKQDLILARHIVEEGRGLILVVNKIDLIDKKKSYLQGISQMIEDEFFQIKKPYIIGISALKDNSVNQIIDATFDLYEKWQFSISTSKLNVWLQNVVSKNQPPSIKGKRLKIKYASQVKQRPCTINIWSNFKEEFPESYLRYIQNEFYSSFNLWGSTNRFIIQKSDNPYKNKPRLNTREIKVINNRNKRNKDIKKK